MSTLDGCVFFLCAIAATASPGCALFSKGDQSAARFFNLERAPERPNLAPAKAPGAQGNPAQLRLGRVTGSPHLEERLVFRDSAYEIRYYRELRWTEPPEQFLKRLLARVLFEERGFQQVVGGGGPTLDVQLMALDEIRLPQHLARTQLIARLHDEHLVHWEKTLTMDRPVVAQKGGDLAAETVQALGEAMRAAVDQIVDSMVRELEKQQ